MPVSEAEDKYDIETGVETYTTPVIDVVSDPDPFEKKSEEIKALNGVEGGFKRRISTMEKRYTGQDGAKSKKEEEYYITGYNAFNVVAPPISLDAYARLYKASAPHFAAINAKVYNIVGLGHDFVESRKAKQMLNEASNDQKKRDKLRKKLSEGKDAMEELIELLNEEDNFAEVLSKVWKDYEATGNGYIEVGRTNTGRIGYVGHVPSTTIRIRRDRDGFVQIISNRAVFFRNFGKDDPNPLGGDSSPNELIHIKKYAPGDGYYGVPDIVAAQQAIAGNEFAARFNLDYFENKAVPRHVVVLKGATINPRLAKNILEFFETGLKGQNHRSLFVPLPADTDKKKVSIEFKPVEAGVQDSSFNNYRKANMAEILMVHRVPISKVSTAEGASLAIARDADKTFKEQVCRPEQAMLEKKINKIFKEFTDLFVLKLNEMTLTDEDTQSKIDERRRKTGTETANEQRVRRGMPTVEGGDELFDMNAAMKVAEMSDQTARRGQDLGVKTAEAKTSASGAGANANGNPAGTRQRDTQRSAGATDSAGESRNPKGDGRTTA